MSYYFVFAGIACGKAGVRGMIELLVKYIQDKGYEVEVNPGYLTVRKRVDDLYDVCHMNWAISKYDLIPGFEGYLQWKADRWCQQIDKAIAEGAGV